MSTSRAPNVAEQLKQIARSKGEATFCSFVRAGKTKRISFEDLYERSLAYAETYRQCGVVPGDVVIIMLRHTPDLFFSFFGAVIAGAVPSFMPFLSPKQRPELFWNDHNALFRRIEPRLLVTYAESADALRAAKPDFAIDILVADDALLQTSAAQDVDYGGFSREPADLACLQHSSGTTSLKKGVMLTHQMVLGQLSAYAESIRLRPEDILVSWLPLYHDMGFVACFLAAAMLGNELILLDPFEWVVRPATLLDAIEKHRATLCWLPNFAFAHLVNATDPRREWDLSSIRAFINCSEPCKMQTFERFFDRFRSCGIERDALQVCYAMAENVFAVTQTEIAREYSFLHAEPNAFAAGKIMPARSAQRTVDIVSCGRPISQVQIEIRDGDGKRLAEDRVGQIYITGGFLFHGYYRLPQKTSACMDGDWYRTGDTGFLHDGELYVTGRIDDMLIVNGRNYYAHEIESIASLVEGTLPGRNIALGVEEPAIGGTTVVVLVECRPGADGTKVQSTIRRSVYDKLALSIHAVVPMEPGQLVKTTSGKISRSKNKELYVSGGFIKHPNYAT